MVKRLITDNWKWSMIMREKLIMDAFLWLVHYLDLFFSGLHLYDLHVQPEIFKCDQLQKIHKIPTVKSPCQYIVQGRGNLRASVTLCQEPKFTSFHEPSFTKVNMTMFWRSNHFKTETAGVLCYIEPMVGFWSNSEHLRAIYEPFLLQNQSC